MLWLALLLLAPVATPAQSPAPAPVTLSAAWTSVALPDTPLGITAQGGNLWVVGENEMVAESTDRGRTWSVLHENKSGGLLFSIQFVDNKHVYAYGSDHLLLESSDGGRKWDKKKFSPEDLSIEQVANFRGKGGFAIGPNFYGSGKDDSHWKVRSPLWRRTDPGQLVYSADHGEHATQAQLNTGTFHAVLAIPVGNLGLIPPARLAATDASHAIALCDHCGPAQKATIAGHLRAFDEQALIVTADSGSNWKFAALPKTIDWTGVRGSAAGFQLFGVTNAGGPVAMTSKDGLRWESGASPAAYSNCNAQGCLLKDGAAYNFAAAGAPNAVRQPLGTLRGWADLSGPTPKFWALPNDTAQPLTDAWAAVGDTFCRVSTDLRCRTGSQPLQPASLHPEGTSVTTTCLHCSVPEFTPVALQKGYEGVILFRAVIQPDGHLSQVLIEAASKLQLANDALDSVKNWTFRPLPQGSAPMTTRILVQYFLHYTPASCRNQGC